MDSRAAGRHRQGQQAAGCHRNRFSVTAYPASCPYGARATLSQSTLVLPLTDTAGAIHGLQYIAADGTKRFLLGSKVTGNFFLIGDAKPSAPLYIAEGFATAAAIHKAMGVQVAVAFNAGNLKAVTKSLHHQWPEREIVLCADDDAKTSGNPGLTAARAAAQAVGGKVAVPNFGAERPNNATDFCDLALFQGSQAVRNSILGAASAFPVLDNLVAMSISDPGYPFYQTYSNLPIGSYWADFLLPRGRFHGGPKIAASAFLSAG